MIPQSSKNLYVDWVLVFIYMALVIIGWFTIFAVTGPDTFSDIFNFKESYGKQLLWIGMSMVLIVFVLSIENQFYERYSGIFYIISIAMLLGLFVFGKNINGQTNWYSIGGFTLQPSEFVKITTALAVSSMIGDNLFDLKKFKDLKYILLILFIPIAIIVIQKDVGSALVFFSFIFVLLRKGLSIQFFYSLIGISVLFIITVRLGVGITLIAVYSIFALLIYYAVKRQPLFFRRNFPIVIGGFLSVTILVFGSDFAFRKVLEPHHQDRIELWLRMENSPEKIRELKKTYGYNNDQSIQTIASGGFTGKGFLDGDRTNGKFVPEQHTDYIFSAIGEEFGFLGSSLVIILFLGLILRLLYKAEIQKSKFNRYYGYSVAAILFTHFAINIGMVLDILPTVGIPLPFISYGGSSLWAFTILLFIFVRLDASRLDDF
ncbi:MAG: rod shape-determining protein RodA [Flavobacteriaceae bacterium]|nr:rod shape-determining protein RodA [Flavobacteriaceae bacterium]